MKLCAWLIGTSIVLVHSVSIAQSNPNYRVEFYADLAKSSCAVDAASAGVVTVHVFHTGSGSSTGLLFSAFIPPCWPGAVWLDDHLAEPWGNIGATNVPFGLSIGYGECKPLPIYVGRIEFYAPGGTPSCCELAVTHPTGWTYYTEPTLATDCDFVEWPGTGKSVMINGNGSCPCSGLTLAVQPSTWGHVKALYR